MNFFEPAIRQNEIDRGRHRFAGPFLQQLIRQAVRARRVRAHEKAGQHINRITVSGGIARSDLMCRILATVLARPLHRLQSFEGPALGAAVTALSAVESYHRRRNGEMDAFSVPDAVGVLVKFRDVVEPVGEWREAYQAGLGGFERRLI